MATKSEPKTQPTDVPIADFLATVEDVQRRKDCETLVRLMRKTTGEKGCMWGSNIVGFGTYRYQYANGSTGDWPVAAFSPRKGDLTLYLTTGFQSQEALMARLGKYKTGKVCLYVKRLADVDLGALEELVRWSVAAMEPQRVRA